MKTKVFLPLLTGVALLSTPALAADPEVKFGGMMATYLGQYNDGTTTALVNVNEANINAKVKDGDATYYFEVENRNGSATITTQRYAELQISDLAVKIGTIYPKANTAFSKYGGLETSQMNKDVGAYNGDMVKTEADGLGLTYTLGDAKLEVTLYDQAITNGTLGTSSVIGVLGTLGDLEYRVAAITDAANDGVTGTGTHVGVEYKMGDWKIGVDNLSETKNTSLETETAVKVDVGLGEDSKVMITAASNDNAGTPSSVTQLVYETKVGSVTKLQVLAISGDNNGTQTSFLGAGFAGKF